MAQPSSGAPQPAAAADRAAVPGPDPRGAGGVASRLPLIVRGEIATLRFAPPPAGGGDESSENGIQVQEITIDGNILLQQRNPLNQEIELQIEGDQLKVVPQDATHRRVSVHGNSNRPVTIVAAELSMRSDQVTVDQKANRLWIDGSGNVRGQLAGALNSLATGEANRAAEPAANAAFAVNSTLRPPLPPRRPGS